MKNVKQCQYKEIRKNQTHALYEWAHKEEKASGYLMSCRTEIDNFASLVEVAFNFTIVLTTTQVQQCLILI